MRKHDLERYLSPHQAAAWVVYRDVEFVKLCTKPDIYHGQKFWPDRMKHGEEQELARALIEGHVMALGRAKGEAAFTPIAAITWQGMRVASQYPERHHWPFAEIRLERDELLKVFPPLTKEKRSGRPVSIDYDLVTELAKKYVNSTFGEMTSNVRADYEKAKSPVSESSVKRHLWSLGYGGSK